MIDDSKNFKLYFGYSYILFQFFSSEYVKKFLNVS